MSSSYHPQSDGQTENLNKGLELYLRCFVADAPTKWVQFLPWAELWYNTAYQTSAGMTPFQALYGRPPPTIIRYLPGTSNNEAVDIELRHRDLLLQQLQQNLLKAQTRIKWYADKNRRDESFDVGDLVWVKLQPYRQTSLRGPFNSELCRRFYGPFSIVRKVGTVAYKLALPPSSRIHPVFHVSLLKRFKGPESETLVPLPELSDQVSPLIRPLAAIAQRTIIRQRKKIPQILIQWEGLSPDESTWEDLSNFKNLEDKVHLEEGGIVMNQQKNKAEVEQEDLGKVGNKQKDAAVKKHNKINRNCEVEQFGKGMRTKIIPKNLRDFVTD